VIDGEARQFPSTVWFTAVDQSWFQTMGISLLQGRAFTDEDRSNARRVAIVSESFGRMLADGGDPLGHRITMPVSRAGQDPDVLEVVGVVSDVITDVSVLKTPVLYMPIEQYVRFFPFTSRSLVVRAAGNTNAAHREVFNSIRQVDPAIRPAPLVTLEAQIGNQMSSQRFGAYIMGTLGAIAMMLTLIGTYVLAESMAVFRMREMGIRAALGAKRSQLAGILLAETMRLVGAGLVGGLLLTWTGANTIRAFLFQVQPLDVATLATMSTLILVLSMTVSLRPALHAARTDIARVLKEE
jgi:putative ABC transport system permease protein